MHYRYSYLHLDTTSGPGTTRKMTENGCGFRVSSGTVSALEIYAVFTSLAIQPYDSGGNDCGVWFWYMVLNNL